MLCSGVQVRSQRYLLRRHSDLFPLVICVASDAKEEQQKRPSAGRRKDKTKKKAKNDTVPKKKRLQANLSLFFRAATSEDCLR